jgi:hypothetical protein
MSQNRTVRLLALAIWCVLPAFPAIVTYTGLAAWQEVTRLSAIEDFNTFTPTDTSYPSIGPLSGMTFTSPGYDYAVKVTDESGATPWGTGRYLRATYVLTALRVDLTPAVTAFAALLMIDNGGSGSEMIVTARNGLATWYSAKLPTSAKPAPTFFGVVSTTPGHAFTSVTFTPQKNLARLDDVSVGVFVPEPGTGALALGGAALLALGRLRKR